MSFQLIKEAAVATVLFLGIVLFINLVPFKFEFIKPIKQEFDDFDIYDLFYSGKDKENSGTRDKDVIIVQAAGSRGDIADQVSKIRSLQPAVIGVDLSFAAKKEAVTDSMLVQALSSDSVITGYTLDPLSKDGRIIKEAFLPAEFLQQHGGFINFSHVDSTSVIRSFAPFFGDKNEYISLAARITERYSKDKFGELERRRKEREFINYSGGLDHYLNYTADEFEKLFQANQLSGFKGKIVLLGFFTPTDGSAMIMDDIKFSPLNQKPNGKSFPDVYGVVIHANIISMILDGHKYVSAPSIVVSYIISFIICFFIAWFILFLHKRYDHPSHLLIFVLQLVFVILLVFFFLKLFDWYSLRINLLPIILVIVVSVEMFELYKRFARFLNRKSKGKYRTIFSNPENSKHT